MSKPSTGGSQRIIPLEEGWNDEIKAKVCIVLWTMML